MKAVKIIVAIVLAFAAINSLITLTSTEQGAGFGGVLIAFFIMISISGYLFYSATKSKEKDDSNEIEKKS